MKLLQKNKSFQQQPLEITTSFVHAHSSTTCTCIRYTYVHTRYVRMRHKHAKACAGDSRDPYDSTPVWFGKKSFCSIYYIPLIVLVRRSGSNHAAKGVPPELNLEIHCIAVYHERKLTVTPIRFNYDYIDHEAVRVVLWAYPVKPCLYFGHFAAIDPLNTMCGSCVTVVMGWYRPESETTILSPKFDVQRNRWRENSFFCQVR